MFAKSTSEAVFGKYSANNNQYIGYNMMRFDSEIN